MAIALAAVLSSLPLASQAQAQNRGNAQAEQSQALGNRNPAAGRALPPTGRYVADSGEAFILDRSGQRPLLRFDRRDETWVLRPTAAPRGDVIYRNDAGDQLLRVTPGGGMTVYTPRAPGGSPASFSGPGQSLTPPTLGPTQLFQLMARRSAMLSQTMGRLIEINVDTDGQAEGLAVEALILSTDAVLRIARSPTARSSLDRLRSITIIEGQRASVTYARGDLRIVVAPVQGVAGRPSSARVIQAFLAPPEPTRR
ncbi:MAG: DUF4908 domain-containing protein [Brevundimonas sp.]|uniref:DUF4908 domain-containing protein n=1 Tax=Brevundimonas sp. TaxID=1871086 RepID=UPI002734F15A|nr:DUF4908 domain-containing protein [Brevundimonas sp.]MDP3658326.1 DUF4908 domain-containing protein [Brevundimonas sp.]